jgi:hypothetical protein
VPLLFLGVLFAWTIIVFRIICFRTTLGPRTLLTLIALGAPLGVVANPLAEKFFNSYRFDGSQSYTILMIAVQHLLMVAPVLLLLARPAWRRGSSIGDGFLAAFAVGAGYEFFSALLALAPAQTVPTWLSFLPPGVATTATITVAGYGYWCGFVALICAAAFRFLRNPLLAWVATALALLVCTLDHYAAFAIAPQGTQIAPLMLHGALLPSLTILVLIGCVVMEMRWAKSTNGIKEALGGFQAIVSATAGFKWNEAKLARARYQLSRQAENLCAEQHHDPANTSIQVQARRIDSLLAKPATTTPAAQSSVIDWLKRRWPQLLAIAAFLCLGVFFNMPSMAPVATWVWTSLPLATPFPPFQLTLLVTVLIVVLFWRYIQAPSRPYSQAVTDEVAQFSAEHRILQLGLGIALLALLYPHPGEFTALLSPLVRGAQLQVPGYDEAQGLTLVLVLVWAVGTLTVKRAGQWRQSHRAEFLTTLVRNLSSLCSIAAIAWIGFTFFTQIQIYAHARWGETFFNLYKTNGNSVLEMMLGAVIIVFTFGVAWLVRWLAERAEDNLLEPHTATQAALAARR